MPALNLKSVVGHSDPGRRWWRRGLNINMVCGARFAKLITIVGKWSQKPSKKDTSLRESPSGYRDTPGTKNETPRQDAGFTQP